MGVKLLETGSLLTHITCASSPGTPMKVSVSSAKSVTEPEIGLGVVKHPKAFPIKLIS